MTFTKLLFFISFILFSHYATFAANIKSFSHSVSSRQVRVVFDEPVVTLGDFDSLSDLFVITCSIQGKGRWVNQNTWIYTFEQQLPLSTQCEFKLSKNLKTFENKTIGPNLKTYYAKMDAPTINETRPFLGSTYVNEEQAFILILNGDIDRKLIEKYVYFKIDGLEEKININVIEGSLKDKILKQSYLYGPAEEAPKVIITAKRNFPSATQIHLVLPKELRGEGFSDQVLSYKTREPFSTKLTCQRKNYTSGCSPFSNLDVYFSNNFSTTLLKQIQLKNKQGKKIPIELNHQGSTLSYFSIPGPHPPGERYTLSINQSPNSFEDEDGRTLSNLDKFPLEISIDQYPPLLKFSAKFGIMENKGAKSLPLSIRHIEPNVIAKLKKMGQLEKNFQISGKSLQQGINDAQQIIEWMSKLELVTEDKSLLLDTQMGQDLTLDRKLAPDEFEVLGIDLKENGFHLVELQSKNLNEHYEKSMYVKTGVLLTNLGVHLKWGKENTLVWVSHLDDASVAQGIKVILFNHKGEKLVEGITNRDGIVIFNQQIKQAKQEKNERGQYQSGIYAFAWDEKNQDMSFVHTSWNKGIEPYRFGYKGYYPFGNVLSHAITDRPLYQVGETLHMNLISRGHGMKGPTSLRKGHNLFDNELVISFGYDGSYEQVIGKLKNQQNPNHGEYTWKIPKQARLGHYRIILRRPKEGQDSYSEEIEVGRFQVEEFKVPLSKAFLRGPTQNKVSPESLDLDFGVEYLSGSGAADLGVTLRTHFSSLALEKQKNKKLKNYLWNQGKYIPNQNQQEKLTPVITVPIRLNANGQGQYNINQFPNWQKSYTLKTELEYKDPNGEIKSLFHQFPIYQSPYMIGIKTNNWIGINKQEEVTVAMTNRQGIEIAQRPIKIELFQKEIISHRKKLVGGYYGYTHTEKLTPLGQVCQGNTKINGLYTCKVNFKKSGNLIVQAQSTDQNGKTIYSWTSLWVLGEDDWWFQQNNTDRMELIAERKNKLYSPGEKAKLQVRSPFKHSQVLFTVEREGVIDYFIHQLDQKKPLIELPILDHYGPNIYVTALAIRGRVSEPKADFTIDLGRPTYKFGFQELYVGHDQFRLKVDVRPSQEIYKAKEMVHATIQVHGAKGQPLHPQSQVTISVVDDGLLQLAPNNSWNLLKKMMRLRSNNVKTSTAQMQVVGRRHYGKKALPHGGGGGQLSDTRELFDTLLYWKSDLELDSNGMVKISFPGSDSLTSFTIAAIVTNGNDRFGTGFGNFKITKDFQLYSGIPKKIRLNDQPKIEFGLRNMTEKKADLDLEIKIPQLKFQQHKKLTLEAKKSQQIKWDLTIPNDTPYEFLDYNLKVTKKNTIEDQIAVHQIIRPNIPIQTYQGHITQVYDGWFGRGQQKFQVQRPQKSLKGKGGIKLIFKSSLAGAGEKIKEKMLTYPYSCFEQKASKAVATDDRNSWDELMASASIYQDTDGYFKYFSGSICGSDILTAYILRLANEASWPIDQKILNKALEALQKSAQGQFPCANSFMDSSLTDQRRVNALEALSRYNKAEYRQGDSIKRSFENWNTLALINWYNFLKRTNTPNPKDLIAVEQLIHSKLNFESTSISFANTGFSTPWLWMSSSDTQNIALLLMKLEFFKNNSDTPKYLNGVINLMRNGTWDLTTANALGQLALKKASNILESGKPSGETTVHYNNQNKTFKWKGSATATSSLDFPFTTDFSPKDLRIQHNGDGKPWVFTYIEAAIPQVDQVQSGFSIKKSIHPLRQKKSNQWSVGDVIKVVLEVEAQGQNNMVVVDDPIPVAASILGKGLGQTHQLTEESQEGAWPNYIERTFEAYRAYFEFLPQGKSTLTYTMILNAAGRYQVPPTKVHAMYRPDTFGLSPNNEMVIHE